MFAYSVWQACRGNGAVVALEPTRLEIMVGVVQNDMRIGAAKSKTIDRSPPKALLWPGDTLSRDSDMVEVGIDIWVHGFKERIGQDNTLLKHHDGLDKACETGTAFQVANIGLDGATITYISLSTRNSELKTLESERHSNNQYYSHINRLCG